MPRRAVVAVDSFEIGISQGCRISETRLRLSDVDGRIHRAPLHPDLKPVLLELKQRGQEWTYDEPRDTTRLPIELLDAEDAVAICRVGRCGAGTSLLLSSPGLNPLNSCTSCRGSRFMTVVSRLARANITERKCMAYVGHASLIAHRIYQRIGVDDLADCVAALKR